MRHTIMKNVYIFTCVNSSMDILTTKVYSTREKAMDAMLIMYQNKLDSLLEDYTDDEVSREFDDEHMMAYLNANDGYDSYGYYMEISETKIDE